MKAKCRFFISPKCHRFSAVCMVAAILWFGMLASSAQTGHYLYTGYKTNITLNPGVYDITVYGAQGGKYVGGAASGSGGLGAEMAGRFNFTTATTLTLLVGSRGGNSFMQQYGDGGGGGGSFVVHGTTPLVVAGGGGGGGSGPASYAIGGNGITNTYGGNGLTGSSGSGGNGGSGGGGGAASYFSFGGGAGGGGGYSSNGGTSPGMPQWPGNAGGGTSFPSGGTGGACQFLSGYCGNGGFGGGGAGGAFLTGGGGGGYSGGGGGGGYAGGGGGGSFIDSSAIAILAEVSGIACPDNPGSGEIIVAPGPKPIALALAAAAGGQFGFNITGPTNATIVMEACTNLANPVWVPLVTNALNNSGTNYFSDAQWTNRPNGYYRVREP